MKVLNKFRNNLKSSDFKFKEFLDKNNFLDLAFQPNNALLQISDYGFDPESQCWSKYMRGI